jgi:hypothetical protein
MDACATRSVGHCDDAAPSNEYRHGPGFLGEDSGRLAIERDTGKLEACVTSSVHIDSIMLLADLAMILDVQRTISASTSLFGPVSSSFSSAQYTWAIHGYRENRGLGISPENTAA